MGTYAGGVGREIKGPVDGACAMGHASTKRWEDKRHAGMIEWVVGALQSEAPRADVAELNRWWNHPTGTFKRRLLDGLKDADYVDPYYNHYTFTSHFYDPDTEENYLGENTPTAKTQVLTHFRKSLALRQKARNGPDAPSDRDIGYELGLALHYVTDMSQPMHAANFTNWPLSDSAHGEDYRHAWFEAYAETYQDHFIIHRDSRYLDNAVLFRYTSVEGLLKAVARHAKQVYTTKLQPFLIGDSFTHGHPFAWQRYPQSGKWPDDPKSKETTEDILANSIPFAELHLAALLLHWTRGYHSIVDRIFHRLLDRAPDANDNAYYADRLANQTLTVLQVIGRIGGSDEYFLKKVKDKSGAERRKLLGTDFMLGSDLLNPL